MVVLKDTSPRTPARALAAEAAGSGDRVGAVYNSVLSGIAVRTTAARAAVLAADPRVTSVEPDAEFRTSDTQKPAPWPLDPIDRRDLPLDGPYAYATTARCQWMVKDAAASPGTPAVANMSMGGTRSYALDAAVTRAVTAGITFTVAADSAAGDACAGSPAAVPVAVTVGATDSADGWASFSNHGRCVDLSAPGLSVISAWKGSTTTLARASGTSMAAPPAAGVAALVLAEGLAAGGTAKTPAEVSEALVRGPYRTASRGSPPTPPPCCCTSRPPPASAVTGRPGRSHVGTPRIPPAPARRRPGLMGHQFLCASGESKSLTSHHRDASMSATAPARPPPHSGWGEGSSDEGVATQ
ncbi:S8 family serine peptidase [Streptomyces sp. NPDC006430]|uniref:S8 family serine peptidase n=1 Tax=Streptomyces sp. NPDC006430 TaxID=3154299 RepID=UPI0033B794F2